MRKRNKKATLPQDRPEAPRLDHAKSAVLNSLSSPHSRRNYKFAMEQFITWYCSEPRLALNRAVVLRFRLYLESLGLAAGTSISALRQSGDWRMKLQIPACSVRNSLLGFAGSKERSSSEPAPGIWLTREQLTSSGERRRRRPAQSPRSCNAFRARAADCAGPNSALTVEDLQIRQGHWAIVDLVGKGGHVRTVPVPAWVKGAVDRWRDPRR